jgi:glycosyltransferase involved in cell wall biosynthesis
MRICYLADAQSSHTQKWAAHFAGRGDEVHVISFRSARLSGVECHPVAPPLGMKLGYVLAIPRVRQLIRRIKPDILHAHYATSYGLLGATASFHPFVLSVWGDDILEAPRQSRLLKWLVVNNLRRADHVTATSRVMAAEVARYLPGKPVHTIPFGIDTDLFRPGPDRRALDAPVVGIVKLLRQEYGVQYLLEAFARIAAEFPAARLRIVGDGPLRGRLEALAADLSIAGRTDFVGAVPHHRVPEQLAQMDVFVMPSLRESFGVAALEASACALPVLATRVGGIPEVVADGQTGFLVSPADALALVAKLRILLQDACLRTRLGDQGRQFVLQHYRWDDTAGRMAGLYSSILESET